ncbi:hypothetical protein ORI20_14180 [Mycobacterium sp. CVI_P3]|uniref:DUF4241 domain-containing protein n=1 Tax=Mycobacterium pinniadriaticum TaxID=2994102 RepID=A0ABT3SEB8_9MYCO|nr:hypothetical protein [Mycobacterium pinniadriaticum]MCX2931429.1 hypothetical protein [Mycobacterium pinniadriaticum]MCX2937853.1 hypothetical protein [Mycobacterium pinniadriaticum]
MTAAATIDMPDLVPLGGRFLPSYVSIDQATGTLSLCMPEVGGSFSPTIRRSEMPDGSVEWGMEIHWPSKDMRVPGRHYCAEYTDFPYREYGAEIVTDPTVYPLSELQCVVGDDDGEPMSEFAFFGNSGFEALNDWDRIDVHSYEAHEGVTSGHVWRFVDGGVIIGDVELQW